MQAIEFCYWLQGFMEIGDPKTLNEVQVQIIKDHIALVLNKVTPERNGKITTLGLPKGLEELQKSIPNALPAVCSGPAIIASNPNPHQVICSYGHLGSC